MRRSKAVASSPCTSRVPGRLRQTWRIEHAEHGVRIGVDVDAESSGPQPRGERVVQKGWRNAEGAQLGEGRPGRASASSKRGVKIWRSNAARGSAASAVRPSSVSIRKPDSTAARA